MDINNCDKSRERYLYYTNMTLLILMIMCAIGSLTGKNVIMEAVGHLWSNITNVVIIITSLYLILNIKRIC